MSQCASCWKEALYYCCWNTSYCSYACQQTHWVLHQADCRQAFDAAEATAASEAGVTVTMMTAATAAKTAESSNMKSLLGKGGVNGAEKDEMIQVIDA